MGTTDIGYRAKDVPVNCGGFVRRAQLFVVEKVLPKVLAYELGNIMPAGAAADPIYYRGRLVAFSMGAAIEGAFGGGSWKAMLETEVGAALSCPKFGITGAKCTGITYVGRLDGWGTETFTFEGTGFTSGGGGGAPLPTGAPGPRAPQMSVAGCARLAGYSVRATARANRLGELGNENIVGTVVDNPEVRVDLDFILSDLMGVIGELSLPDGGTITIALSGDGISKSITVSKAVSTGVPYEGTVGGWATQRYTYVSTGQDSNAGLAVS